VGRPIRLVPLHWVGFVASGLVLCLAFTWDFRNVSAGGMPRPFHWPLFALGEVIGLGTFLRAVSTTKQR
jgi:hypothetical protein